jgi:DNA (cytosine-5)-methyltransferase 1
MTHIDLFSGIGGFALAAERAGFKTEVFCENNQYCRQLLKLRFPGVPIIKEIRGFDGTKWRGATVLTGGFPCQDVSLANTRGREGLNGSRSGLWVEMSRIIDDVQPKYIIVENVPGLLIGGLGVVLGDLAESGYDAEWYCIPASGVGAPHQRERIWIVAYPRGKLRVDKCVFASDSIKIDAWNQDKEKWGIYWDFPEMGTKALPRLVTEQPEGYCNPKFLRISDGIPNQLDRLKALGNAVVPQIPEIIMRGIKEIEG